MTIIEFAQLSLPRPTTSTTPLLLKNLVTVTDVIQQSSHLPTRFFSSINHSGLMFVIGGWPSKSAHQDGFEGSPEQAKLFPLIEGMMEIDWMEYFDLPHDQIPMTEVGKGAMMVLIIRCGGLPEKEKPSLLVEIKAKIEGVLRNSEASIKASGKHVFAWNIKKEVNDPEETVLAWFSGWESHDVARQVGRDLESAGGFDGDEWVGVGIRDGGWDSFFMEAAKLG